MNVREHIRAYQEPFLVNAMLLLVIAVALSLANSQRGDSGGSQHVLFVVVLILFSGPLNLVLLWALNKKVSRHTA